MQGRKEEDFTEWLLKVGNQTLHTEVQGVHDTTIIIPAQCITQQSLIMKIFSGTTAISVMEYCSHVIVCSKNANTLELNQQVLHWLQYMTI